jgi:hypothetical protein
MITGSSVRLRSASVASARTQREATECGDHRTTTAPASRRARSMVSSKVSPARSAASHHTVKPLASNASAKRRAAPASCRA